MQPRAGASVFPPPRTADGDGSFAADDATDTAAGDVARGVSFAALNFFDAGAAEDDEDKEEEEEGEGERAGGEKESLLSLFVRGGMVVEDVQVI